MRPAESKTKRMDWPLGAAMPLSLTTSFLPAGVTMAVTPSRAWMWCFVPSVAVSV
jgi:hypothetical protein